jgi:hypothetical protein
MADEVRILYDPGIAFGSRVICKVPANDAGPTTLTTEVLLWESIAIWTRLPRVLADGTAEFRTKLPRVSVVSGSGAIVPELTKTFPVRVPTPLNVPLCELRLRFLQTAIGAWSISPFTLKFALLTVTNP